MDAPLKDRNWWIWLICGTLIGIIIMLLFGKGCIQPKTVDHLIYKSDTVVLTVDKFVIDTVPQPYETVLPEKVIIYETVHDTLYQGAIFGDTIRDSWVYTPCYGYNQKYLSQYRFKPKLLQGDFTHDSISLTLLDTSGTITKRVWPISYSIFDYHFRDNRLLATNREPINQPIKLPSNITTSANVYGFYSVIHGGFTVSSDFWVTRKRWSIGAIGELRTYQSYGDIRLGAKYSIK